MPEGFGWGPDALVWPRLPERFVVLGRPFHGVHLALGKGNGDVVLFESSPDLLTQFTADFQGFKGGANREFEFVGD